MRTRYAEIQPYVTLDGSLIRELIHPGVHGNRNQSLAEAEVPPGGATRLHRHHRTEEIYHITAGCGLMTLSHDTFKVGVGDSICIPPGTPHRIRNIGADTLRLLCCCAPAYAHEDTELVATPDDIPPQEK